MVDGRRLQELCGEIRRVALELERAAGIEIREAAEVSAARVRALLRARRGRCVYFDSGLFADPAWDMMLDLLAARLERRAVSVSSLCLASGVAQTTALRWIGLLVSRGLIVRRRDCSDGRRVLVTLSEGAATRMRACLGEFDMDGPAS